MNTMPSSTVTAIHKPVADRRPSLFQWQDPTTLPLRLWLYGHDLLRGQVLVTMAAGGVGKSSLAICEALAMVSGRKLLDDLVVEPLRLRIINLDDPLDELVRPNSAFMLHYTIIADELGSRLYVNSGRNSPMIIATQTPNGVKVLQDRMDWLPREVMAHRIDVLIIDPFISSHQVNENDNGDIDVVARGRRCRTSGAPRWSSCVHQLRNNGIQIKTELEPHEGSYPGHHARYWLACEAQVAVLAGGEA